MCAHYETPEQIDQGRAWSYLPRNPLASDAGPRMRDTFPNGSGLLVRRATPAGSPVLTSGRFGLLAHWVKPLDLNKAGRSTYNARTETVHEKPSFRSSWQWRRWAIIPALAIYEPYYESGRAVPWRISRADGGLLAIAGIHGAWRHPESGTVVESFAMLTIAADEHSLLRRFHAPGSEKRMVVILEDDAHEAWLHATHAQARAFFRPYPASALVAAAQPRPAS